LQQAHQRLAAANAVIDHIADHGMSLSVYFLDPDGIMMELFCDTFDTQAKGLAFMKATSGQADQHWRYAAAPPFLKRILAA